MILLAFSCLQILSRSKSPLALFNKSSVLFEALKPYFNSEGKVLQILVDFVSNLLNEVYLFFLRVLNIFSNRIMQMERKANNIIEDSIAYRNSLNVLRKEMTEKFLSLSVKAVLQETNLLMSRKRNFDLKWVIITAMTCHDCLLKWILSPEEFNYVIWMVPNTLTARVVLKKKGLKMDDCALFLFLFLVSGHLKNCWRDSVQLWRMEKQVTSWKTALCVVGKQIWGAMPGVVSFL